MNKKIYILLIFLIFFPINKLLGDWLLVHYEKYEEVESINCIDSNNCFALVNHPSLDFLESGFRIYESIDNGIFWKLKYKVPDESEQEEPKVRFIRGGIFLNADCYYIIPKNDAVILKMLDSGRTLIKIILDSVSSESSYLRNLAMYDSNYGFVANGWNYFTTKDGWETFEKRPKLNRDQTYYSPVFMDSNTVEMTYANRENPDGFAFLKYHINEGKWDTLSYFGLEQDSTSKYLIRPYHIFFVNDTLGFASGSIDTKGDVSYDYISRTTDGGYNWNIVLKEMKYPEVGLYNNIAFADEKNGIAVGFYGKIAMTNDGGDTWVYEPTPNAMDNARKMLVCWAGRTPLIGTWDAGIFRYEGDFFDFPISVKEILQSTDINIRQTPEKLLISIEDENFRKYKLQISDIMGNIVLEQELNSGIGTLFVPVDISGLTNGAYLYMISSGGVIAKTGKIIFIQ